MRLKKSRERYIVLSKQKITGRSHDPVQALGSEDCSGLLLWKDDGRSRLVTLPMITATKADQNHEAFSWRWGSALIIT